MFVYEIEYVDCKTGDVVTKSVAKRKLAKTLSSELAMAQGKRAIIRRREGDRWTVIFVDLADGHFVKLHGCDALGVATVLGPICHVGGQATRDLRTMPTSSVLYS